jgi:hypothetical protein
MIMSSRVRTVLLLGSGVGKEQPELRPTLPIAATDRGRSLGDWVSPAGEFRKESKILKATPY